VTNIPINTTIALYWGHVTNSKGVMQFPCSATLNLFKAVPRIKQRFSIEHGVSLKLYGDVNLMVDGSHHLGDEYDNHPQRKGVPWAACINSSSQTGIAANCVCKFYESPLFDHIRQASHKLGEQGYFMCSVFASIIIYR